MRHEHSSAGTPESQSPSNSAPSFTFVQEESTMSSGTLPDAIPPAPTPAGPKFRPYASSNHHVTKGRYITSNDPRGYIPVYEYPLNGQWIMMDIDDGYILWTGIWKALGNSKADIVKMIDSQPDLAAQIRRVALRLSRRVAWPIREDLVPLFGPTFPSTCLSPDQPGYGQVVASAPGRRRTRRNTQATQQAGSSASSPPSWSVVTATTSSPHESRGRAPHYLPQYAPYSPHPVPEPQSQFSSDNLTPTGNAGSRDRRYTPYPSHSPTLTAPNRQSSQRGSITLDMPPIPVPSPRSASVGHVPQNIVLPPITSGILTSRAPVNETTPYALPPISALEDLRGINANDSAAVLRRLQSPDNEDFSDDSRARSSSMPLHQPTGYSSSWPPNQYSTAVPPLSLHRLPSSPSLRSHTSRESVLSNSRLSASLPSDDGRSCAPSPVSPPSPSTPATPQSMVSGRDLAAPGLVPLALLKEQQQGRVTPIIPYHTTLSQNPERREIGGGIGIGILSTYRRPSDPTENMADIRQPYRPW
uniref:Uncharacterized protein n=1 Tax=Moniliophthora roreri TaxID=221103 RepID=A0A0W0GFG6_MONRR